jgi:predicted NBD/HSP70 family sugar kinase
MGSLGQLRDANRSRVVDVLRRRGSASRGELSRLTGLSRTTIATLVGDLQARGLLVEQVPAGDDPARGGPGRPPARLRLHPLAGAAVGIDVRRRQLVVALADLSSTVLAERRVEVGADDAGRALDAAAAAVQEMLDCAGLDRARLVGAGMALPGPVEQRARTPGSAALLPSWADLDPAAELERRLGVHVLVDNDANLGALAEHALGAGRGVADLVYVSVGAGIGAGLVLGGRVHRGASGVAGELGHVQVHPDGVVCHCGSRGCLGTVAAAGPLVSMLRPTHGDDLTLDGLLALVARGDAGAQRVVGDAGRTLGAVLAGLCNYVNPAMISVGGELSAAGEPLLAGIREGIDRGALPAAAGAVRLVRSPLGERAGVLGALSLVIGDTEGMRSAGLAALRA